MATALLWILALLLILSGIAGLLLPALPGAPLLFAGLVVAAWAEDFAYVGGGTIAILALLAVLTYFADLAATAFGARLYGASKRAAAGAALGAVAGLFFGLPGVIIGPFVGAVAGELSTRRDLQAAGRAGVGTTIGLAIGVAVKMALAFAMLGLFITVRLFGAGGG